MSMWSSPCPFLGLGLIWGFSWVFSLGKGWMSSISYLDISIMYLCRWRGRWRAFSRFLRGILCRQPNGLRFLAGRGSRGIDCPSHHVLACIPSILPGCFSVRSISSPGGKNTFYLSQCPCTCVRS